MNTPVLQTEANGIKRNLTFKFVVAGIVTTLLVVLYITASGYYLLRSQGLQSAMSDIGNQVDNAVLQYLERQSRIADEVGVDVAVDTVNAAALESSTKFFAQLGLDVNRIERVNDVAVYSTDRQIRWASISGFENFFSRESDAKPMIEISSRLKYQPSMKDLDAWINVVLGSSISVVVGEMSVVDSVGKEVALLKMNLNLADQLQIARNFAFILSAMVLLGSLLLFAVLYLIFRNRVLTIYDQEQRLSQQVDNLSNLLSVNKSMQLSIKTASARAVELNEQFLRRVGADLHDGPAQMIGYAVLRLNQISRKEAALELGHEFHAVKEALEESLDEIRGISSGLVLPELESMSLEQCLRKVVALHGVKSSSIVTQYYTNIGGDIPLPVKITAYRFVQEGLNNSHRHGQAEKCRITAQIRGGELHLSLKDNGMGFRMSQLNVHGGHLGLLGLKDRVESLGGKFSINSELGIGTAIKLVISLVDDDPQ